MRGSELLSRFGLADAAIALMEGAEKKSCGLRGGIRSRIPYLFIERPPDRSSCHDNCARPSIIPQAHYRQPFGGRSLIQATRHCFARDVRRRSATPGRSRGHKAARVAGGCRSRRISVMRTGGPAPNRTGSPVRPARRGHESGGSCPRSGGFFSGIRSVTQRRARSARWNVCAARGEATAARRSDRRGERRAIVARDQERSPRCR